MAMTAEELESTVLDLKDKIDTILKTVDDSEKKYKHDKGLEEFTERNGETLGKYADKLKKLNGDDFDIMSAAFDEYNNDFSDIEEATYVAQLVSEIDNKIAKLKEALGEDDIEIHSNDEGETEVNAHDTKIEAETDEAESKEEAEDEKKEESDKAVEEDDKEDTAEEDEDDAEADFVKELEADYEKFHR